MTQEIPDWFFWFCFGWGMINFIAGLFAGAWAFYTHTKKLRTIP